jgi:hypothetical protein
VLFRSNVLGESYYIDFDRIEEYIDMSGGEEIILSGGSDMRINIVKYELIKTMIEVIISEDAEVDEKLGIKNSNNISVPFKIAFNSLLNKNIINHY